MKVRSKVVAEEVDGQIPYNFPCPYDDGENILIPMLD